MPESKPSRGPSLRNVKLLLEISRKLQEFTLDEVRAFVEKVKAQQALNPRRAGSRHRRPEG